ncbi:MAG: hypothetical protein LC721_08375 [Actinobacteria bacterium]|nr:hypothetical protein [Actinomycetota bacterium]
MTYFVPTLGHHGSNVLQRCSPTGNAGTCGEELAVCPGSDATRMVGGVLVLVAATIVLVLVMVWWLI